MLDPDTPVAGEIFEQMCIRIGGNREPYLKTDELVRGYLFSRYPGRKNYMLAKLREYWNSPVEIETIMADEYLVSLIRLSPDQDWYVLVRYEDGPILEEVPTEEDMKLWPSE